MVTTLTTTEVAALVGIDEKRVRKEIEHGIFARPSFTEADAVYLRALVQLDLTLAVGDRSRLHDSIVAALGASSKRPSRIDFGSVLELKLGPLADFIHERLRRFDGWKKRRIVTDPNVLGGEPVFARSRLAVRHVGELLLAANDAEARDDYPYLTDDDFEFAPVFVKAYPRQGRPRERQTAARREPLPVGRGSAAGR